MPPCWLSGTSSSFCSSDQGPLLSPWLSETTCMRGVALFLLIPQRYPTPVTQKRRPSPEAYNGRRSPPRSGGTDSGNFAKRRGCGYARPTATSARYLARGGLVHAPRSSTSASRVRGRPGCGAMRTLGLPSQPVCMGRDRAPIWPDGLTGSLSHTETCCVVVLTQTKTTSALGIDLEPNSALDQDLIPEICTPAEQFWVSQRSDPAHQARLIFSAKEAVYKAQYSLSRTFMEFRDLCVIPHPATRTYRATFQRSVGPFKEGRCLTGHFLQQAGLIVTLLWLRPNRSIQTQL